MSAAGMIETEPARAPTKSPGVPRRFAAGTCVAAGLAFHVLSILILKHFILGIVFASDSAASSASAPDPEMLATQLDLAVSPLTPLTGALHGLVGTALVGLGALCWLGGAARYRTVGALAAIAVPAGVATTLWFPLAGVPIASAAALGLAIGATVALSRVEAVS